MNNLKLSAKMLLLSGIFTICLALVGYTGWSALRLLGGSVQLLGGQILPEVLELSKGQVGLFAAIRSQKNAVLSQDDGRSQQLASESRSDAKVALDTIVALRDRINRRAEQGIDGSSDGGIASKVDEVLTTLKDFSAVNEQCLTLAVKNTNVKANDILFKSIRPVVEANAEALRSEIARRSAALELRSDADSIASNSDRSASELLNLQWQVMGLLAQHVITSAKDPNFSSIDRDVAQTLQRMVAVAEEIGNKPNVSAGLSIVRTNALKIAIDAQKVVEYSREDSNNVAAALSLHEGKEKATKAVDAMAKLFDAFRSQSDAAVAASVKARESGIWWIQIASLIGVLFGGVTALIITRGIIKPIGKVKSLAGRMAAGDLTERIGLMQSDEVGELAEATDTLAESLTTVVARLKTSSGGLGKSSDGLSSIATGLATQSQQATERATSVAAAAEELSANINTMSAAAEEMTMNFASIASATEEMSVSVGAVSSAAEQTSTNVNVVSKAVQDISNSFGTVLSDVRSGAKVASEATAMADTASKTMRDLDQAGADISDFTETIKMIALQTNLLALNATIEATSAGEAGKGFAVVAHEIKELANQSARAAEDISKKIESVHVGTRQAVGVMRDISSVIKSISESAERITHSVESQTQSAATISSNIVEANQGVSHIARAIAEVSVTAKDMSRSLAEATRGASDVSRNVSEAANAARGISASIQDVTTAAKETSRSAGTVTDTACNLANMASELRKLAEMFKIPEHG